MDDFDSPGKYTAIPVGDIWDTAERLGVQLPPARCSDFYQKMGDLAREAVNCNAGLGC